MSRRIVVIQGHPDRAGGHLCHALADAYADNALRGGHSVERIEIAAIEFPVLRSQAEYETGEVPPALAAAAAAIATAEHIVLVFPLWLGTMPALVKAFLEQVMRPGIAFEYRKTLIPEMKLAGRSARVIVTMAMPAFVYRWYYRAHGIRVLARNIFNFVGIKPVRTSFFGAIQGPIRGVAERAIEAVGRLGRNGT